MSVNTLLIECGHCGNTAPMEIKAEYVDTVSYGNPPYTDEVTTRWDLLLCPVCRKPTLHETIWSPYDIEPETMAMIPENKTLYPSPVATTEDLPETVRKSYEAALKVRNIEPNAFAVLIGRTLEFICQDKNAVGRDLNAKLDNLSERNEIPERLAEIAHKIRILRNVGAHADKGEISPSDIPILLGLTESILDYLYKAPAKLETVKQRIERRND